MKKKHAYYDIIIIGGGPAGLTAAIYTGRAKLKTLVLEKSFIGGSASSSSEIINYPGFPSGITGLALTKLFHEQAKLLGAEFKLTAAKKVNFSTQNDYTVDTFRTIYHAKSIIITAGGIPRLTNAKNEEKFLFDKGISFCATCDAAACENKTILVVGSGNAALEEAIFLSKFAKKIFIAVRKDESQLKAGKAIQSEAKNNPKLSFIWNKSVSSFNGDTYLDSVSLKDTLTGSEETLPIDRCFLFIGYTPDSEIFAHQINCSPAGYIKTNEQMQTSRPGIFAAGDIREKTVRQIATAIGDGATAAITAGKYIDSITNNLPDI